MTLRIIHVSDRHYGQAGAATKNAQVNNHICARDDASECIVIDTGDVVETPSRRLYDRAADAERELVEKARAVLKQPGNHDKAIHGMAPHWEGPVMWNRYTIDLLGDAAKPVGCPRVNVFDNVAVVGLDSNRRPSGRAAVSPARLLAQGHLGDGQIEECAELVREHRAAGRKVVVAVHHCLSGGDPALRLRDRDELGKAIKSAGGCDAILSGHLHERNIWRGLWGADWIFSAPKTPEAQGYEEIWWEDEELRHRWIDVDQLGSKAS